MRIQSSSQRNQTHPCAANQQHQAATRQRALALAVSSALLGATGTCLPVVANAQLFPAVLELSSLDGSNGFKLDGTAGDYAGTAVSNVGDVNNDGVDDLLVSAPYADPNGNNSGRTYVVFGRDTASQGTFPLNFQLSSLDGSNGFKLVGEIIGDRAGTTASGIGDINGDGLDDFAIGARYADPNGTDSGRVYVIFGRDTASVGNFPATLQLSALDGSNGFKLDGELIRDRAGTAISGAGDINNDGIDDLIIGAPNADTNGDSSGSSYVVYGKNTGTAGDFPAILQLSALDGNDGFVMHGESADYASGRCVAAAGDINGDGISDIVIGAPGSDACGNGSGCSYVVFGRDAAVDGQFPTALNLAGLDGNDGFKLSGEIARDLSGNSCNGAGDINGDGLDDLIIGARRSDANGDSSGRSYVVFGRNVLDEGNFPANLQLSALDGSIGFKLDGAAGDDSGGSVDGAGDVNGDGIADILISAENATVNSSYEGRTYVVFGRNTAIDGDFPASLELPALNADEGFQTVGENGGDFSGNAVSSAGDINGDGVGDILIAASTYDRYGGSTSGRSYVVFGRQLVSELSVRMRDCRDPARPGGTIEYGIQISNQGPDDAADVLLESILPTGLSLLSASPGGLCTETGGNLSCNIGNVAADTVFSLGLVVSVGAGLSGPVSTSVTIATENADNPINNLATETTIVLGDLLFLDGGEKCGP